MGARTCVEPRLATLGLSMKLPRLPRLLLLLCCAAAAGAAAGAQGTTPAVLLSDVHFDPFHNPHDVPRLLAAPVEQWPAILDASTSLVEDAERATLKAECGALSTDTTWPLLKTTLAAAHDAEPHPVFVTLSGDLLAHEFQCRLRHALPTATPGEVSAFGAKTVAFVVFTLRAAFPHVPVYVAMGNNDSGCADYDETPGNSFAVSTTATMMAAAEPAGLSAKPPARAPERQAQIEVSPEGDYSIALPAPLEHGRLIVLQDVYDSQYFLICGGGDEHGPEDSQITWLRTQLSSARARHENVWVMGHIPPGVDVYASFHRYLLRPGELCSATLHPFFYDFKLADTLLDYADVIRLGLFAHTHMDEVRYLHRPAPDRAKPGIPLKLVPSVTPYFGNHPAFLVAAVDPGTLQLKDYQAFVSPALDGSAPPWTAAYRFSAAYGLPDFSAASAARLAEDFTADPGGKSAHASTYREHFFAGDIGLYALGLNQIWPAYACAVREDRPEAFHNCLCPIETKPAP